MIGGLTIRLHVISRIPISQFRHKCCNLNCRCGFNIVFAPLQPARCHSYSTLCVQFIWLRRRKAFIVHVTWLDYDGHKSTQPELRFTRIDLLGGFNSSHILEHVYITSFSNESSSFLHSLIPLNCGTDQSKSVLLHTKPIFCSW